MYQIEILYEKESLLIFSINHNFSKKNLTDLYNFVGQINYKRIVNYKKSLSLSKNHLKNFFKNNNKFKFLHDCFLNDYFINKCINLHEKIHKNNKIYLKNNFFNKFKFFFNRRIVLYDFQLEFSSISKEGFIFPHTDRIDKIISLMLYLPKDEDQISMLNGTTFYELKNKKYHEHGKLNRKAEKKNLKDFYENSSEIFSLPFDDKKIYGFVKSNTSWHELKKINSNVTEVDRRSINVNIIDITKNKK